MATQEKIGIRPLKTVSGNPPELRTYPEAATQTYKKGELVYLVSGKVTEFTDAVDDGTVRVLGIAAVDASGTTDTDAPVWIFNDDTIFVGTVDHTTAASAVTAVADVSNLWPFKYDTTNSRVTIDKEDTASQLDACRIVGIYLPAGHTLGDIYGQL